MAKRSLKLIAAAAGLAVLLGGGALAWNAWLGSIEDCCAGPDEPAPPMPLCVPADEPLETGAPALGMMTSLPLYWPAVSDFAALANGDGEVPWQRRALERCYSLEPLDTLSADASGNDPLLGRSRLAVIQPRGLSPSDNAALDTWVRSGGRLLLVLDPMLTGEYDRALGDPRRPSDIALIPPVAARWGLEAMFDEAQSAERMVDLRGIAVPLSLAGEIRALNEGASGCTFDAESVLASCAVGEGRVTLFADAAVFEGAQPDPVKTAAIQMLMHYAFEETPVVSMKGK